MVRAIQRASARLIGQRKTALIENKFRRRGDLDKEKRRETESRGVVRFSYSGRPVMEVPNRHCPLRRFRWRMVALRRIGL
jgi:hypothetical protein